MWGQWTLETCLNLPQALKKKIEKVEGSEKERAESINRKKKFGM